MDLQDGIRTLLDVRFADDILFFAKTFGKKNVDELVMCLAEMGLHFNVGKTKNLTTQPQSPNDMPSK